jgi:GTPase
MSAESSGPGHSVRRPRVAIVGRPNVGKSSLFNFLTRTRNAVVKNQPGVTRDIQVGLAEWWGKSFDILDTGGLTAKKDEFSPMIFAQVVQSLGKVDLLVVMFDAKSGLHPEDRDIMHIVRESGKKFIVVVNKVDSEKNADLQKADFYEFSDTVIHCAVEARARTDEVVEAILENVPFEVPTTEAGLRIAILGKPNAGKSSICNRLLGEYRMLVSEVAGTTVDAIEETFTFRGRPITIVDTAGLRKQAKRLKRADGVEILSSFKSFDAVDRADLVFLVVDAVLGPSEQDAKLYDYILSRHKAVLMVANKMDLLREERPQAKEWFRDRVEREFHFASDVPFVFTSSETGEGFTELLEKALLMHEKLQTDIPTSELNNFFYDVIRQTPSPVYGTQNVKFYYLTQTSQTPPSFIAFANQPDGVTPAYRRFLMSRIKANWGLEGIPVRVFVMKSGG